LKKSLKINHRQPADEEAALAVSAAKCRGIVPVYLFFWSLMFYSITTHPSRQSIKATAALNNAALQAFLESTYLDLSQNRSEPNAPNSQKEQAAASEKEESFNLTLDLPGLAREQIEISIEANIVRVSSTPETPRLFNRAFRFAQDIDALKSHAKLENGVLTLVLGKQVAVSKIAKLSIA
jgi:HSP20 family molecular chaperone IbpA